MATFLAKDMQEFLRALDTTLRERVDIVIIGGGALALAYGLNTGTEDIDTFVNIEGLRDNLDEARRASGVNLPVEFVPVADAPINYEERLQQVKIQGLRFLNIRVPDLHDLVLMKVIRANQNDIDASAEVHRIHRLSKDILFERFTQEMNHVIGDPARLRLNFLFAVEAIFGESIADDFEARLNQLKAPT